MKHVLLAVAVPLFFIGLAGCEPIPGDGTGVEGKWQGNVKQLLELAGPLPLPVDSNATLLFNSGALTVSFDANIPVISCLSRLLVHGTYKDQNQARLKKLDLNLNKIETRILFITIPVKDVTLSTLAIYTIKDKDVLYLLPEWQKVPQEIRDYFEENPELIPWEGAQYGGYEVRPIKLYRVK